MSGKGITLSLKVPTRPPTLLHILENSLLEGVVDYKPLDPGVDPRAVRSRDVTSAYQLKADVSIIEDELQVHFIAKNIGLHVARIFANTKEVCHAISFNVSPSGEVYGLDAPPPKQGLDQVDVRRSKYGGSTQSAATTAVNSAASTLRAVESEHRLSRTNPTSPKTDQHVAFDMGTRHNIFDQLLRGKSISTAPNVVPPYSRPGSSALTTEMFKSFGNSEKMIFPGKFGRSVKTRCHICLRKAKLSKSVSLLDMAFCDPCFTNLFLTRSAIDHFMPPTIKESIIQVPVNKRRTKFASVTKELPDINLKGLTPNDVRAAQTEFNKFDMEGDGWLEKVILLPLIKACFTPAIPEPTIRRLLCGQALQSMIETMELHSRDSVHEIEFLSLMAFVARESLRVTHDYRTAKFTEHDLAMAYAFQHQKSKGQHKAPSSYHLSKLPNEQAHLVNGVRKSFTDSPLSQYQPKEPLLQNYFHQVPTPSLDDNRDISKESDKSDGEVDVAKPEDDSNLTGEHTTPSDGNATEQKTKQKDHKHEEMEDLKLTGDKKADGWMMY